MSCLVFKDKQSRRIEIAIDKPELTVGRDDDNDIVIPFRSVSRHHCTFTSRNGTVSVRDVGSSNGSKVNEEALQGEQQLHNRDRVKIGEFRIRYYKDSKYPNNSLQVGTTQQLVLFGSEPAVTQNRPSLKRPAKEPAAKLPIVLALGAGLAAGIGITTAVVLTLLWAGVLKID